MEFIQLKYFQAVAKTGKIVSAAKSMFVTPPAISSAISQLERELGTPLFSRVGNRLILNQQGQILLRHTNTILFNFGAAKAAILESLPEGPMHISVSATESHLLSDLITAFSVKYPDYTITLNATTGDGLFKGAFQYRYAFLMTTENNINSSLTEECHCVRLFEDHLAIMVHRDHPLANRDSISISDLTGYPLIHSKSYPDYCSKIYSMYEDTGLSVPLIRSYSHLVCQTLMMQNNTVSLTTLHSATASRKKYVCIPLDAPDIHWTTLLCWRKNRDLTAAEQALIRFMSEFYGFSIPAD